MPKTKSETKSETKAPKQLLSPEQRSQIAKDRWAKRRAAKAEHLTPTFDAETDNGKMQVEDAIRGVTVRPDLPSTPEPPMVGTVVGVDILTGQESVVHTKMIPAQPPVAAPTPQPAPAAPKKQKRTTPVPKEFLVALKTADQLLAKAIEEYEHCEERLSYLRRSIPRLQQTVQSLRRESNPDTSPVVPHDFSGFVQSPVPQYQSHNPLAAIQAMQNIAMPQPPSFKASGGAIQFGPEVVGSPEEDEDRYIGGPNAGNGGWIGG